MTVSVPNLSWHSRRSGVLRVAVVGGSTPFLCGFVDEVSRVTATRIELRLLGRDQRSLNALAPFVHGRLATHHRSIVTDDVGLALEGADCVLVQPRVGGLAARASDEELASSVGAPADEGLGPGGLRAALRTAPVLRGLARELRQRCPSALVIGFTNPLSSTVSVLGRAGVPAVGVCELPRATAAEVAARLSVPLDRLHWCFSGLNHRGMVHDLRIGDDDVLDELVEALGPDGAVGGIPGTTISALRAVPLKYHSMLSGAVTPAAGRGRQLARLRSSALDELRETPETLPPSIAGRSMPWYADAVLPLLLALAGVLDGHRLVLDRQNADDVVRELHCDVGPDGITLSAELTPQLAAPAATWVDRFVAHEAAIDALLEQPCADRLVAALERDPATPTQSLPALLAALSPDVDRLSNAPVASNWFRA